MRLKFRTARVMLLFLGSLAAAQTGTVTLTNVGHPWAQFEVGDTFLLSIQGAAQNATVTVTLGSGAPYTSGMTDNDGNWSVSGTYTDQNANLGYTEHWYVNGVFVPPDNPKSGLLSLCARASNVRRLSDRRFWG